MPIIQPPAVPKSQGLRVALFGTSIIGFNVFSSPNIGGHSNQYNPAALEIDTGNCGYFNAYNALAGHPFFHDPAQNHGIPGNTTNQMRARYASDIAANYADFDWLWIEAGANDYDAGITKETTLENIKSFAKQALSAGKTIVIVGILPRTGWGTDVGTQKTQGVKNNLWVNQSLRNWVFALGSTVPAFFLDAWSDLSDPTNSATTGASWSINTNAFQDGLHPNGYGAYLMGKRAMATLPAMAPFAFRGRGAIDNYDAADNPLGNLLSNSALFTTTGGTNFGSSVTAAGGVPANWRAQQAMTGAGSFTAAEVIYSTLSAQAIGFDPTLGNVAQFVVNIAGGKASVIKAVLDTNFVSTVLVPGDKFRGAARVRLSGLAGFCGAALGITYTPDNGATKYTSIEMSPNGGFAWGQDDHTLTLVTPIVSIPPNITPTTPLRQYSVALYFDATGATAATGTALISDLQMNRVTT